MKYLALTSAIIALAPAVANAAWQRPSTATPAHAAIATYRPSTVTTYQPLASHVASRPKAIPTAHQPAAATPSLAIASQPDIIGGPDGAQTVHHCGFLQVSKGIYTDSPETLAVVEQKLMHLGFLKKAGNGKYGKADKAAVRAFQRDAGLKVDGVVGPVTAQRLAYETHPSANVKRCWRNAVATR